MFIGHFNWISVAILPFVFPFCSVELALRHKCPAVENSSATLHSCRPHMGVSAHNRSTSWHSHGCFNDSGGFVEVFEAILSCVFLDAIGPCFVA